MTQQHSPVVDKADGDDLSGSEFTSQKTAYDENADDTESRLTPLEVVYTSDAVLNQLPERLSEGTLLEDFSTLDKLTLPPAEISAGASISTVTDVNGNPAVRLTAGTVTTTLDVEIPIQNFAGLNEDGTDFDGIGLMFYMPNTTTMSVLNVFLSATGGYGAGDYAYRGVNTVDGKLDSIGGSPRGGWNWIYLPKSIFTLGTLDMTDPSNLMMMIGIRMPANSGSIDLSSLWWNLPKPTAQAVITFDDAYASVYTEAFPYMQARGIKGTVYICGSLVGVTDYLTLPQLQELHDAGWDICNHSYTHVNATDYNTPELVREYMNDVARNDRWLADNGFYRGRKHYAYPNGTATLGLHDVAIEEAGYKTARVINSTGTGAQHIIGTPNRYMIPAKGVTSTVTVSDMTTKLDNVQGIGTTIAEGGRAAFSYFHEIKDEVGNIYWSPANFEAYIDDLYARIQAGNFEAKTITEWSDYAGISDNA